MLDALTPDIGISHYLRLFKATYRELRRKQLSASYRMVTPSEIFFKLLADETPQEEPQQPTIQVTLNEVKTYAANTFKKSDFKIFMLRYFNGMTLSAIGDYIGRSTANVCIRDGIIRQQLQYHFA